MTTDFPEWNNLENKQKLARWRKEGEYSGLGLDQALETRESTEL